MLVTIGRCDLSCHSLTVQCCHSLNCHANTNHKITSQPWQLMQRYLTPEMKTSEELCYHRLSPTMGSCHSRTRRKNHTMCACKHARQEQGGWSCDCQHRDCNNPVMPEHPYNECLCDVSSCQCVCYQHSNPAGTGNIPLEGIRGTVHGS